MAFNVTGSGDFTNVNTINGIAVTNDGNAQRFMTEDADGDITAGSVNTGGFGWRNQLMNTDFDVWTRCPLDVNNSNDYDIRFDGRLAAKASKKRYFGPDRWYVFATNTFSAEGTLRRVTNNIAGCPARHGLEIGNFGGVTPSKFTSDNMRVGTTIELSLNGAGQFRVGTNWTFSIYSSRDLTGVGCNFRFVNGTDQEIRSNNQFGGRKFQRIGTSNRYYVTARITDNPPAGSKCVEVQLDAPTYDVRTSVWVISGAQLEQGDDRVTVYDQKPLAIEQTLCKRYCTIYGGGRGPTQTEGIYITDGFLTTTGGTERYTVTTDSKNRTQGVARMKFNLPDNFRMDGLVSSGVSYNADQISPEPSKVNNKDLNNTNQDSFNPYVIAVGEIMALTPNEYGRGLNLNNFEMISFGDNGSKTAYIEADTSGKVSPAERGYAMYFATMVPSSNAATAQRSYILFENDF